MQLFIPIWLNDLEPKDIKKENFLKLFTFPSLIFLYPCHLKFFTMYIFWLFYNLMKFVSKLIYNIYSFKFYNNKQTKPQHSATIVCLQRFITNVQCCTMYSMEFKRNFLFVYFVYIVTKVCVGLLVQTSNIHRTGS